MRLIRGFIAVAAFAGSFFLAVPCGWTANPDYYNAGLLAMKADNIQEAIEQFTRAIEASPNDYRLYNDRGVAYKRAGNLDQAIADYTRALEIKPDYTNALNNRGVVYLQQGNYDGALNDFNEALKSGGIEGKIYTNMGIARARKGDHRSAIKDFDLAVSFRPLDYRSFLFMGESLEQIGDREKALKMYQVALGLIREPEVISQLEKKIASLEKVSSNSSVSQNQAPGQKRSSEIAVSKAHENTKRTPSTVPATKRDIVPAASTIEPKPVSNDTKPVSAAPRIENLQEIEKAARESALRSFSNSSAEIFKQGLEFVQKSDPHKALVRFEDARQLEKRNRNALAVAWCQLYIARLYSSMGDLLKAFENGEHSFRIFNSLKAHDEMALALIELGNIRKASGLNDQASVLYTKASNEATLAGRKILDSGSSETLAASGASAPQQAGQNPVSPSIVKKGAQADQNTPSRHPDPKPEMKVADVRMTKPVTETIQTTGPSRSETRQRPSASPDKIDMVGRGPVLWGSDGPTVKSPGTSTASGSGKHVSAGLKNIEAKLGPDQLLPDSANPGTGPVKKESALKEKRPDTDSATRQIVGVEALAALKTRDTDFPKSEDKSVKKNQPDTRKKVSQKSIDEDLNELRKLKKAGDEKQMSVVLERLAEKYSRTDQYEKALSALNISLAFREKNGFKENEEVTYNQRGLINEKLGHSAQALEDYTKALYSSNPRNRDTEKILESKSRSLAGKMGLDTEATLDSLRTLWMARTAGDAPEESRAFSNLARMYTRAGKYNESLSYLDKASAALMTEKSKVLEKLGRYEQAQKEMDQALEAFRKLDYSQYLNMMRHSKRSEKMSRN